jgi:hypothetical protein
VIIDLARRAHDHNWEMDPITRSLLDTDFYKLLMLQFIWKHFPRTRATFTLDQPHQLPCAWAKWSACRRSASSSKPRASLRFRKSELVWLAGNTFFGRRGIFEPAFLDWLEHDFRFLITNSPCTTGNCISASRGSGREHRCGKSTHSPDRRIEDACRAQAVERTGARHSLRARQNPALGKAGAFARRSRSEHQRLSARVAGTAFCGTNTS